MFGILLLGVVAFAYIFFVFVGLRIFLEFCYNNTKKWWGGFLLWMAGASMIVFGPPIALALLLNN